MNRFLPVVIAVFLTIVLTWPLLPNITSYYPDDGDYPLNGAVLWYNYDSIITGRIFSPKEYWQGFQFYPHPYSLAFANNPVASEIFFAPIYFITSNLPFSVNAYVFLTFVLSFLAAFYMINYFIKNPWASLTGAFIFAFNSQTFARFPQHIDILSRYFLPLLFLFFYSLLEKPTWKKGFLVGLFFTLNALTHTYYPVFGLIFLPLVSIPFLIGHIRKRDWGYFLKLGRVGLIGLIFLPVLLYFNLPVLQFSQKEGARRSLSEASYFSARINDYFAPHPDNFLYKGWVKHLDPFRTPRDPDTGIFNYEEHTLFIGLLPMILFFLGLKPFIKQKLNHSFFFILLLVSFLLSFGPYFNGEEGAFKLPFYYLSEWVPVLQGIRSPARFEFVFLIPFALISAYGAKHLFSRWPKNIIIITIIIFIIIILENLTPKDFSLRSQVLGQEKLQFLKGKVTLHLPIYTTETDEFGKNSVYLNWATQTGERIVNGNASYLPGDQLMFLWEIKNEGLGEKNILRLKALGVDYVIVHKDQIEIIDLAKINLTPKICSFPGDFAISEISIKNVSDCFLPSIYEDRYRMIDQRFLRMPIIIGPGEQVVLSEINSELRIR